MRLFSFFFFLLIAATVGGTELFSILLGVAAIIGGVKLIKHNKKSKVWNILFVLLIAFGVINIVFDIAMLIVVVIFYYALMS